MNFKQTEQVKNEVTELVKGKSLDEASKAVSNASIWPESNY